MIVKGILFLVFLIQYGIKSKEEKEANEKAQREQETAGRVGRQKKTPEEIAAEMNNDTDEGKITRRRPRRRPRLR